MSKKVLGLAVGSAVVLSACGGVEQMEEISQSDAANKLQIEQMNKETQELAKIKEELQKQDPTVKEVFKGVDEEGREVINVAREDSDGNMLVAGMVGLTTGMLLSNLMQPNYTPYYHYTPTSYSSSSYRSYKTSSRQKYARSVRKSAVAKVRSNPSKYTKVKVKTSNKAFGRTSSSARSSGYSRGG